MPDHREERRDSGSGAPDGTARRQKAEQRAQRASMAAKDRAAGREQKPEPHPATAEIIYSEEELEFLRAVDSFKRKTGRQFPTLKDLLGVMKSLGYTKGCLLILEHGHLLIA